MTETNAGVRSATGADAAALSAVLARAFDDDPIIIWMFPDGAARALRAQRTFSVLSRWFHLPAGGAQVSSVAGTITAVALWDPPERWQAPVGRQLAAGPAMVRAMGRRVRYGGLYQAAIEKVHPRMPHWYLATLGTEPDQQGRGLGSALLRARLGDCDRARLPAYLEASKPGNIGFYERFGFAVTGEITLPAGGPTIWPMWREPA